MTFFQYLLNQEQPSKRIGSIAPRDSITELMRLVCMVMILIHHIATHGFFSTDILLGENGKMNLLSDSAVFINSFCYIGVNVFLLITGYYGIRFKFKGLLKLYVMIAFYGLIQCVVEYYLGNYQFTIGTIKYIFLPFTNYAQTNWWFMNCYVVFYLLSPLIRLNDLHKQQYQLILLLVLIVNLYFGYWWKDYNRSGYCVAQFVFMYVIGGYIRRFVNLDKNIRYKALLLYFGCCMLHALLVVVGHYVALPHWYPSSYNNPLIVFGAIGFFCFMMTYHFQSRIVNRLALSAISIYLLQDINAFKVVCDAIGGVGFFGDNMLYMILFLLLSAIAFSIVAVCIDQVRLAINNIVMNLYDKLCTRFNHQNM